MTDMIVQWIIVGAIVGLCVWRIVGYIRAQRRGGGCSCGCDTNNSSRKDCGTSGGCNGCPLANRCGK